MFREFVRKADGALILIDLNEIYMVDEECIVYLKNGEEIRLKGFSYEGLKSMLKKEETDELDNQYG